MVFKFITPCLLLILLWMGVVFSAPPVRISGVSSEETDDKEITLQMEEVDTRVPFKNGVYQYETLPNKFALYDVLNGVGHISLDEVKAHQLFFQKGIVFQRTGPASTLGHTGIPISYMYVMDKEGNFFVYPESRGVIHHSSISQGRYVAAAGMVKIKNGKILWIDGESGHYLTTAYHFAQALRSLERQGINLEGIEVGYFAPTNEKKRRVTKLTRTERNVVYGLSILQQCSARLRGLFRGSAPHFEP